LIALTFWPWFLGLSSRPGEAFVVETKFLNTYWTTGKLARWDLLSCFRENNIYCTTNYGRRHRHIKTTSLSAAKTLNQHSRQLLEYEPCNFCLNQTSMAVNTSRLPNMIFKFPVVTQYFLDTSMFLDIMHKRNNQDIIWSSD
jgi:hypothetical protein